MTTSGFVIQVGEGPCAGAGLFLCMKRDSAGFRVAALVIHG
jgi:hypothetical protein